MVVRHAGDVTATAFAPPGGLFSVGIAYWLVVLCMCGDFTLIPLLSFIFCYHCLRGIICFLLCF